MQHLLTELETALARIEAGSSARSLETETLEFKRPKPSREDAFRDLAEAAICFANSGGGAIVVGIDEKAVGPDAFVGTDLDPDATKLRIHQLTAPPLLVHAESRPHPRGRLLVILVPQGMEIHSDTQGRASRRIETNCLPMSPTEQVRLREERQGIDWTSPSSGLDLSAASPEALSAARRNLSAQTDSRRDLARLSDRDLLAALGVVSSSGKLLRAGEILFCRSPTHATPSAVYQYRQTPGGEPRDVQRLEGPLILVLLRLIELIQARRTLTPLILPNGQQLELADFPEAAVREAIGNAALHRDYHLAGPIIVDHSPQVFVVTSPGPLVSGVTTANILTHRSKPRNPLLTKAARTLGFAEEIGRGVDRMYREMIRSGQGLPKIESTLDQVRVSLVGGAPNTRIARFVAQLPAEEQNDTDTMLILFHLCSKRSTRAVDLAALLQKPPAEAEQVLRRLASDQVGLLEPTRSTRLRAHPSYRLRDDVLRALGSAVSYQRRTVDELDRKIIAHVREYGVITNRTVQNLLDVDVQRAKDVLRDLVARQVLRKTSRRERGPGIEYGRGSKFPQREKAR